MTNIFAGGTLDRADARRKDSAWVTAALASEAALFLPVWRARSLVAGEAPRAAFVPRARARALLATLPWALLGVQDGAPLFALDLSRLDAPAMSDDGARFEDLRQIATLLPAAEAALLAYARGLMHWRARSGFCGVCGAGCAPVQAGHVMACLGCGAHHFPRTDPAVIMLVTHGDRVLLGRPARFAGVFTTLAGFVEPGESLEEAVAREVFEEAGIRVGDVRYHSSQPWPFPASIMLGFTAEALDTQIRHDPEELVEAGWFTREALRAPVGFALPPMMSIARRLIGEWMQR